MYNPVPVPPRTSRTPNWFAAACGLAYLIVYLAMPFYTVTLSAKTGMQLISDNALLILPALLSIAMIIGALVMPVVASIALSSVTLVMTLIMMIFARYIAISNPLVSSGLNWIGSQTNVDMTVFIISVSYGAIICLALCIVSIVLEILLNRPAPAPKPTGQWVFNNKTGPGSGRGPGSSGGYRPF